MTCEECERSFQPKRGEQRYCSRSCASRPKGRARKGQKTGRQLGREYKRQIDKDGYVRLYGAWHPYCDGRLMIAEHVMVMELHVGRRLLSTEVVHHINGNRQDNRLENLELMTRSEHSRLHGKKQQAKRDSRGRYA